MLPSVVSKIPYVDTGVVLTRNIPLPAGLVVGNTLALILETDATPSLPADWFLKDTHVLSGFPHHLPTESIYTHLIDGSEGATVTVTTSGPDPAGTAIAAECYQIAGATGQFAFGSPNSANNPPSVTLPWGASDVLALAIAGGIGVTNPPQNILAYPTGYTGGFIAAIPIGGGSYVASATAQLTGVTSVDPPAFTLLRTVNAKWAQTMVIKG
jgi:hypothetical protein